MVPLTAWSGDYLREVEDEKKRHDKVVIDHLQVSHRYLVVQRPTGSLHSLGLGLRLNFHFLSQACAGC